MTPTDYLILAATVFMGLLAAIQIGDRFWGKRERKTAVDRDELHRLADYQERQDRQESTPQCSERVEGVLVVLAEHMTTLASNGERILTAIQSQAEIVKTRHETILREIEKTGAMVENLSLRTRK